MAVEDLKFLEHGKILELRRQRLNEQINEATQAIFQALQDRGNQKGITSEEFDRRLTRVSQWRSNLAAQKKTLDKILANPAWREVKEQEGFSSDDIGPHHSDFSVFAQPSKLRRANVDTAAEGSSRQESLDGPGYSFFQFVKLDREMNDLEPEVSKLDVVSDCDALEKEKTDLSEPVPNHGTRRPIGSDTSDKPTYEPQLWSKLGRRSDESLFSCDKSLFCSDFDEIKHDESDDKDEKDEGDEDLDEGANNDDSGDEEGDDDDEDTQDLEDETDAQNQDYTERFPDRLPVLGRLTSSTPMNLDSLYTHSESDNQPFYFTVNDNANDPTASGYFSEMESSLIKHYISNSKIKEISVTPTQKEIITYPIKSSETLQIVSGPGAGKTTTIVYKIAYMIDNLKIDPDEILVLSLTNKAVDNIKQCLLNVLENQELVDSLNIMTFNGFCHKLVADRDGVSSASIIEDVGWRTVLQLMESKRRMNKFKVQAIVRDLNKIEYGRGSPEFQAALNTIASTHKVSNIDVKELLKVLGSMNILTHSEIMARAKIILQEDDLQLNHKVTIVDEFQDMYQDTFDIVKYVSKNNHLVVAGDPNQSIYGFLGSNTAHLSEQLSELKEMVQLNMTESFRSSPEILKCANTLIYNEEESLARNNPDNFMVKEGPKPIFNIFDNGPDQNEFIVQEIQRLLRESDGAIKPSDIAILTRTNAQVDKMTKRLNFSGIQTNRLTSSPTWLSNNLFHFVDYLKILYQQDTANFPILCTLQLLPNIGLVTIKNLYAETVSKGVPLFDILSDSNNKTIIKYVQTINEVRDNMDFDDPESIFQSLLQLGHKLGLSDNISKTIKDDSDKNSVMQQLVDLSENFKLLDHLRPRQYSLAEFFLENYSSVLPISSVNESVKLSTVHSAKGLEFPVVFLPDFKPHGNRPMWDPYASFTLTEEDKRVLYVGMTRAKTLLYMQMDSVDIDPRKNTRMVFSPDLVNYHPPTLDKTLLDTFRNNRVKQFEGHGLPFGLARNFYRSFHSMSRFIKR